MKSNMSVAVKFLAGTSIEQAVEEAKIKASDWSVAYITFDFNGVKMNIRSNTSLIEAVDKFHEELQSGKDHKFVCC
jgi:hypothetical protein